MSSRPAKFVAITAALVLALPPGWCAGLCPHCSAQASQQHSANQPATAAHACCKHAKQAEPATVASSLNSPAPQCCCSVQSAAAPSKVAPAPTLDSQLTAPVAVLSLAAVSVDVASTLDRSPVDPFHTGPPLRVLQCVWRC